MFALFGNILIFLQEISIHCKFYQPVFVTVFYFDIFAVSCYYIIRGIVPQNLKKEKFIMSQNESLKPLCELSYFEPGETEKYQFYKIPKILLTEPLFRDNLGTAAMILYGIMLSLTELSQKNGWIDDNNHIYIIMPVEKVMEELHTTKATATRTLKSLEAVGLIERKSRNDFNRTKITYVKDFTSYAVSSHYNFTGIQKKPSNGLKVNPSNDSKTIPCNDSKTNRSNDSKATPSSGLKTILSSDSKNDLSNGSLSIPSLIDISNKYNNDSYMNNQHITTLTTDDKVAKEDTIIEHIKEELGVDDCIQYALLKGNRDQAQVCQSVFSQIKKIFTSNKKFYTISGEQVSAESLKEKIMQMDAAAFENIVNIIIEKATTINNFHAYILSLINTTVEISGLKYTAECAAAVNDINSGLI